MKNKYFIIRNTLLTGVVSFGMLVGCGKTEDNQGKQNTNVVTAEISDNSDNTVVSSDEQQISTSVITSSQPASMGEQERIDSFQLIAPRDEIKNSRYSDRILQVQNLIIPTDGSMTIGELIEKVSSEYDFRLIIEVKSGEEITAEHMTEKAGSISFCDDLWGDCGKLMFSAYYDPSLIEGYDNSSIAIYDCPITEVFANRDTIYALNIFESGNLCDGLFTNSDKIVTSSAYQERLKEYPECTDHMAFMAYLDSKETVCVQYKESTTTGTGKAVNILEYDDSCEVNKNGSVCYRAKQFLLHYNPETDKFFLLEKVDTNIRVSDVN